jgi:hypothetical protein
MDSEGLWDETGKLRVDLLSAGEADEYKRYRQLLTRNKDAFYGDLVRIVSGTSSYALTENGALKAIKNQVTSGRWVIYKDTLTVHSTTNLAEFQKSMQLRHPVFVMTFIISPCPMNLPLGMFVVESHTDDKRTWHLRRHDDVATWTPAPAVVEASADVSEAEVSGGGGTPSETARAACQVPPVHNEPRRVAPSVQNEPRRVARSTPLRFSHNNDDFDSLLECIHREAFRRLGLKYLVTRNVFQLGHLLPEQSQKQYTTDGILYAAVGAPSSPLQVFHVEIKPGPLCVEEGERCKALCQFLNQNVLCLSGGNVSDSLFAEQAAPVAAAVDYAVRPRHRFCVEMSVYLAQGVDVAPLYCPAVMWHFSEGPCSAPFLSAFHTADPRQWDETRLRLLRVYHLATKDASRCARGSEPY